MAKIIVLPPLSGRGSSHMKPNCSGGEKKEFCNGHNSETCFAFRSCPLSPDLSSSTQHGRVRPTCAPSTILLRKDCPRCSNVCATGSAASAPRPRQLSWDYLLCPVTFRIAILLSNLNKIIEDHFADKKVHTQSCELSPPRKGV